VLDYYARKLERPTRLQSERRRGNRRAELSSPISNDASTRADNLKLCEGYLKLAGDATPTARSSNNFAKTSYTAVLLRIRGHIHRVSKLHFFGLKQYYPSFHRELLSVNAAARDSMFWALLGPILWVLRKYVFED
jgi:hypothetical protein